MSMTIINAEPWILETVGSIAAFCTTISLFPQLVRVWRRKSAEDISFAMFLIFGLGVLSWFIYGVGVHSWPMMVGNGVTFSLAVSILALKLRYDGSRDPERSHDGAGRPIVGSSKIEA